MVNKTSEQRLVLKFLCIAGKVKIKIIKINLKKILSYVYNLRNRFQDTVELSIKNDFCHILCNRIQLRYNSHDIGNENICKSRLTN